MALDNTPALSVRELTAYLKRLLERDELLQEVAVRGEISNFTRHSSGHMYFSLKDEAATLSCVCFRGAAAGLKFAPEDGQRVLAFGSISVYEKQGRYQLMVRFMRPDGVGDLAAALEALRQRLEQEGLFAPERKRPLPRFPRGIGLITSPTGAAVQDMVQILGRRYPLARILVIPTVVQGEAGAPSIVASLQRANRRPDLDVLIVGRGGGSLEDLWCFNEESVARAVFASRLPVVSAVGHETDTTICDYVADARAATPSNAAELIVPDQQDLQRQLDALGRHLAAGLESHVARLRRRLEQLAAHPLLQRPEMVLQARAQRLDDAATGLAEAIRDLLEGLGVRLDKASLRLDALSPLAVLGRGYAIVRRQADQAVVRSVQQAPPGSGLSITVSDGDITAIAGGA
jgi:exodeoxyribonuclease VII large subunit